MNPIKSRYGILVPVLLLLLYGLSVHSFHAPLLPGVVKSAQAQSNATTGSTDAALTTTADSLTTSEADDEASIEADNAVPDDSQPTSTTSSTAPTAAIAPASSTTSATFFIPLPLPGGLDYVTAGTGTRNAGFGTIRLRGIPPGSVVVRAYLYWGTIYGAGGAPPFVPVLFNNRVVNGTLVATAPPPCWPGTIYGLYRASVIAVLAPGLNADYPVNRLPSSLVNGQDPWLTPPVPAPNPLSEGASLVLFYANQMVPPPARVYLNQGASLFFGTITIANPLPLPVPAYSTLKQARIGADGQVGGSTFSILPVTQENTFLNAVQIKGTGSPWN
ncbi:MAG: hypothetical protein ACREDR_16330, partial [Blastocatellia bacterium]